MTGREKLSIVSARAPLRDASLTFPANPAERHAKLQRPDCRPDISIKVFYFFQRGEEFLQCEIRGDDAAGYEIVITEPKRSEKRESFPTSQEAYERWVQLQESLVSAGWWGPHGRD